MTTDAISSARPGKNFDVITSDPIDPWVKGCAALNTVEYYQMCKAHLNPGGVMSLWIPFYESNSDRSRACMATFFKVFPNGMLWSNDNNGTGYDAVLFGRAEETRYDVDQWQERLDRPDYAKVKSSLEDVGFHSAVDLLATYAARRPIWGMDEHRANQHRPEPAATIPLRHGAQHLHGHRNPERHHQVLQIPKQPLLRFRSNPAIVEGSH